MVIPFSICIRADLTSFLGEVRSTWIDLTRATKLKDAVFRPRSPNVEWITMALQTITQQHRDLRQVSIHIYHKSDLATAGANIKQTIGEQIYGQWSDLDHLLNQYWESRSVRLKVVCIIPGRGTVGGITFGICCRR